MAGGNDESTLGLLDIDHSLLFQASDFVLDDARASRIAALKLKIDENRTISDDMKAAMKKLADMLNFSLLDYLTQKKIRHVSLFTDMTFKDEDIQERQALVLLLEVLDFIVHDVITPNDLFWNMTAESKQDQPSDMDIFKSFKGKQRHEVSEENPFLQKIAAKYPQAHKAIMETEPGFYQNKNNLPGCAFKAVDKPLPETKNTFLIQSQLTKTLAEILTNSKGYTHSKAIMLEHMLANLGRFKNILVVDDNPEVISNVQIIKQKRAHNKSDHITINYLHITEPNRIKQDSKILRTMKRGAQKVSGIFTSPFSSRTPSPSSSPPKTRGKHEETDIQLPSPGKF
ncbi:hypothetical protein [Legionella spiritensis]|uniref:hypothetical protein n=1 Tax=Legionella spiritensis TaxID=452 RepID=UPI000F6EA962|nr:hypothetical protein [Legionella spiritensis]VEG90928.1 Uncharacterised protein [Legionella spiritensis]